jgi:mRNA-degrading endonuclease RelE of RelBE toxin-antitoxin system
MRGAASVSFTDTFKKDFSRLTPDIQKLAEACIGDILKDPIPGARRAHNVTPRGKKPTIYTVDVTDNKAYKLSFHLDGSTAVLRRVGTHKAIDRLA